LTLERVFFIFLGRDKVLKIPSLSRLLLLHAAARIAQNRGLINKKQYADIIANIQNHSGAATESGKETKTKMLK